MPTRPRTPPVLAKRLARGLTYIAEDLVNPWDESTDLFHGFSAPYDGTLAPEAALRVSLHVSDRYHLDVSSLDPSTFDEWGEPYVSSFNLLYKVMNATLTDVQRIFARAPGVVRVRTWVVGRLDGHWLVGLRTETTET